MSRLNYIEILKFLSVLIFLVIPPWFALRKHIRPRLNRFALILLFLVYIAATLFTENLMPFLAVMLTLYFIRRTRYEGDETYYLRPLRNKKLEVILYSIGFKFFATIVNGIFVLLLQGLKVELQSQEIMKMFLNASWFKIIILSTMTVIIAPILEEFIFRHILYRGFSKKIGKIASAVLTSSIFALIHYNIAGSISFFMLGIYNCYLYEEYGYRASVVNHFIFNLLSTGIIIIAKIYGLALPQ